MDGAANLGLPWFSDIETLETFPIRAFFLLKPFMLRTFSN